MLVSIKINPKKYYSRTTPFFQYLNVWRRETAKLKGISLKFGIFFPRFPPDYLKSFSFITSYLLLFGLKHRISATSIVFFIIRPHLRVLYFFFISLNYFQFLGNLISSPRVVFRSQFENNGVGCWRIYFGFYHWMFTAFLKGAFPPRKPFCFRVFFLFIRTQLNDRLK